MLVEEINKRKELSIKTIKKSYEENNDYFDEISIFVLHHLNELDSTYWEKHLGTSNPTPQQILNILIFDSHWSEDDDEGIDIFDYILPDDITNYLLSVQFDEEGNIEKIVIEN